MTILHISDLHLDKKTEMDTISYTIDPLVKCISEFNKTKKIDLIVFSGDLIDKGGISYGPDTSIAFLRFYEIFIDKIVECIKLPATNFFMVPGNHDIVRSLDSKVIEKGLSEYFINEDTVNEFIRETIEVDSYEGFNRIIPFKKFEELYYSDTDQKLLTRFSSNFIISVNDKKIGVTCINSSWRCYDSDKDKGKLIIGEYQIQQSINFIQSCDLKIVISHHSLDYLEDFDRKVVDARLQSIYDIHLTGHVHKPDSEYRIHSFGKLYRSIASGTLSNAVRTSSSDYQNGFNIIDFNSEEKTITTYFYRYDHLKNAFVPNNSLGDDYGIFKFNMLSIAELAITKERSSVIENINNDNILKINSHLITYQTDTKAPKTIDELFIMPIIEYHINVDISKTPEIVKDVQELINSDKNYIIYGTKESGKTILLDKILVDSLKSNKVNSCVPVYIDFFESKPDIMTSLKNFLGVNTKISNNFLEQYGVLFLIDNISFDESEKYKLRNLNDLLNKYPKSRIIATYKQLYKDEMPLDSELSSIFEYIKLTIRDFKTKQIRGLINKWFKENDKYETPKKLQTILTAFQALSLPRTPFSVSLFLWIIEKQENTRPINNSTLIENFIEKLLDKQNKNEILSERFDFRNQIRLLADIAHYMYKNDNINYRMSFSDLTQFVNKHLNDRHFNLNTQSIVNRLLLSGIFSYDYTNLDYVRFRFTCFFEFFLVKKMEVDLKFKNEVLSEDNYLSFINEIDYFTGLNREETDVLELILSRMQDTYKDLNEMLPHDSNRTDDLFNTTESIVSKLDQKKFVKYLPQNKPSEEDLDHQEDERLEMHITDENIKKKEKEDKFRALSKILILAMRVLKNSEEINKPGLKQNAFELIIRNSISFAIIYKLALQQYLAIRGGEKDEDLEITNKYLPLLHELMVFGNMGTLKLTNIIKNKIDTDLTSKSVSEFEKFVTVFMYADLRGPRYNDYLVAFIKTVKRNYVLDMAFFKIITYYFIRSKDEETDNVLLNMIGDIFAKTRGYGKSSVIQEYKKRKELNANQMKLEFEE